MVRPNALAALAPSSISPSRLWTAAAVIMLAAVLIQTASGVPPWIAFAPIELSSNVVAAMGLVWALIQLRAHWPDASARLPWLAAACGMSLLAIDGYLGEALLDPFSERREMVVSIGVWLAAAFLLLLAARRHAAKAPVMLVFGAGFGLQILAQYAGWLAVADRPVRSDVEVLEYLNDLGELAATLAYVAGLILTEFAPASVAPAGIEGRTAASASPLRPVGKIVELAAFRRALVRCAVADVTFPPLYRIAGFGWRTGQSSVPNRVPVVRYAFGETDMEGVEDAAATPLTAPDPGIDDGWIIVRRHAGEEAFEAYRDALRDVDPDGDPPRSARTRDGVFSAVLRPAPSEGPSSLIVYAMRTSEDGGRDEADWRLGVAPDGERTPMSRRTQAISEIWVD